jgi:anti-sigma-K factor RskA
VNYLRAELLDRLAGAYVLGTLRGRARRRFDRLLLTTANVRSAVHAWEDRLHLLAVSVPPVAPPATLWPKIAARLQAAAAPGPVQNVSPSRPASSWWSSFWKPALGFAVGALAMIGLVRVMPDRFVSLDEIAQERQALPQSYVGLLVDEQNQPTMLVSSTRHGKRVTVKSLRPLTVPAGKVLQVWALPKEGVPFPLGLAVPTKPPGSTTFDMADTSEKLLSKVPRLGISVEDAPAGPGAAPSGPFILSGHCVKLW